jgi:hypothetical protein
MPTFNNGESAASVRTKINDAIEKVDGTQSISSVDINGGTIDGTVIGGSTPAAISGTTGSFSGNLTVDTNTLFVDAANNRVGVGTSSPVANLHVSDGGAAGLEIFPAALNGGPLLQAYDRVAGTYEQITFDAFEYVWRIAGSERTRIDSLGVLTNQIGAVFNESGADSDFRVESDTQTHAFFVDAGTSRVGINSGAPQYKLHVVGGNGDQLWLDNAGEQFTQQYWANTGTVKGGIWLDNTNSKFEIYGYGSIGTTIYSNTAERVHFKSTGEAVFNDTGNDYDFRVESDLQTHMLFVDASTNRVGINTSSPSQALHVTGNAIADSITLGGNTSTPSLSLTSFGGSRVLLSYDNSTGVTGFTNLYGRIDVAPGSGGTAANGLRIQTTEIAVNDDSTNMDFRVESDTNTHALFVDAGLDKVGIGSSDTAGVAGNGLKITSNSIGSQSAAALALTGTGGDFYSHIIYNSATDYVSYVAISSSGTNSIYDYWTDAGRGFTNISRHGQLSDGSQEYTPTTGAFFVWNQSGEDADFRVESDTNTHLLFVDAGDNYVGIGTSGTALGILSVQGEVAGKILRLSSGTAYQDVAFSGETTFGAGTIRIEPVTVPGSGIAQYWTHFASNPGAGGSGTTQHNVVVDGEFETNNGATFNQSSIDADFRVESDGNAHMLFVDAGNNAVLVGKSDAGIATTGLNLSQTGCTYTHSTGNTYHVYDNGTGPSYVFYVSYGGVVNYISLNQLSDRREKENIVDIPVGLDAVKQLRPRQFDWIKENQDNNVYGFIAQEVEEVLPNLVNDYMKDEGVDRKGLKHIELIAVLTKAMQEQQTMIETLEARLTALENA